jgi:hypothetical protein
MGSMGFIATYQPAVPLKSGHPTAAGRDFLAQA